MFTPSMFTPEFGFLSKTTEYYRYIDFENYITLKHKGITNTFTEKFELHPGFDICPLILRVLIKYDVGLQEGKHLYENAQTKLKTPHETLEQAIKSNYNLK